MTGALAVVDDMPDLLGTAPSDLLPNTDEFADTITARRRAERIRAHLVSYTQMRQDIADAFAYRDWAALGYSSWYGYLEGEFGPELQQLSRNRDERRQAARDLRAGGLSTRQIASVVGVDAKTVRNDLEGAEAPAEVTGTDGKTYPSRRPPAPATAPPADPAAGDESPAGSAAPDDDRSHTAVAGDRPGSPSAVTQWRCFGCEREFEAVSNTCPACGGWGIRRASTDSPAGRDHGEETDSGEAGSPAVATPGQPGPRIVLIASTSPGQPPQRAEVKKDDGGPNVEVIYCDSRTWANVARRRIVGPAPDELAGVGDEYEQDPAKRIAAVAAAAPAFVQPVSPATVRAERRDRISASCRSLSLAVAELLELAADAEHDDIPLDELRQHRDGLDLLIQRLERTTKEGS